MSIKTLFLFFFFAILNNNSVFAQKLSIDLKAGTLNGKVICGFPLDNLTDDLGRPVSIDNNEYLALIIGPSLSYNKMGLEFRFNPESKDPKQGIASASIYLSKTWDEDVAEFYLPFSGDLIPEISGNLKAVDIQNKFAEDISSVRTSEEHKKQLQEIGIDSPNTVYNHVIKAEYSVHFVNFIHEDVTKFLERITLQCKEK